MSTYYKQEASWLLTDFLESLVKMITSQANTKHIEHIYRLLYAIKMSGTMFGYKDISEIANALVDAFLQVREGRKDVTVDLIESALSEGERMLLFFYVEMSNS